MMECMICGKELKIVYKVEIDGNIIETCENCAKAHGRIVETFRSGYEKEINSKFEKREIDPIEEDIELVEDFNELIRNSREKFGLSLEEAARKLGIKESFLAKIESGEILPDKKTLKKMEKFFKIKLEEKIESKKLEKKSQEDKLRIADIVEIK
ncbi:MAG: multiprotein bridging factor aMBF1 [Candidatus Aenigmarchaeota archaeon]|nr:multiprotein bridging factor aMBF1 [Candidatus Aenigmarchaeota archaeon]MDW8159859.1 multiprotein bridging factor aMBF1 [Candidatus Aenigmarchaeota archaeon]